ncbi:MAG: hypothetical protein U0744_01980 [Gemmataceae bacterium]
MQSKLRWAAILCLALAPSAGESFAQKAPYDVFPPAGSPYYRVRYEPSEKAGELVYGANFTVWIPPGVKTLRGVVVHQHGCGEVRQVGPHWCIRSALAGGSEEA